MRLPALLLAALALAGCGGSEEADQGTAPDTGTGIRVESPAFRDGGTIPGRLTCDGRGRSPALRWSGVPRGTAELLLLMEDPDAPGATFVHWLVAHLPASAGGIPAGRVPAAATELEQSFGRRSYVGPCPPEDDPPHQYVFTLYALDRKLRLGSGATPEEVRSKVERAATARGTLRASYGR